MASGRGPSSFSQSNRELIINMKHNHKQQQATTRTKFRTRASDLNYPLSEARAEEVRVHEVKGATIGAI